MRCKLYLPLTLLFCSQTGFADAHIITGIRLFNVIDDFNREGLGIESLNQIIE